MKPISYILISLLPLLIACEKQELPDNIEGMSVFYVDADIEGQANGIEAGKAGYYMHTDYTYEDSVFVMKGNLTQADCPDCPEGLEIWIRDAQKRGENEPIDWATALAAGNYAYANDSIGVLRYTNTELFAETGGSNPVNYMWDLGNGQTISTTSPTLDYTYDNEGDFPLCVTIEHADGCLSQLCSDLSLPRKPCEPDFTYTLSNDGLEISCEPFVAPDIDVISYEWDYGTGYISNAQFPTYSYPLRGVFPICLTVIDADGCESKVCKNVEIGSVDGCTANFQYAHQRQFFPDMNQFSHVVILWRDETGKLFRSDAQAQDESAFFEIMDSELYEVGKLKLNFRANCTLWHNFDKKSLVLQSSTFAIGIN